MKLNEAYEIFNRIESEIRKLEDRWGNLPDEFEFDYDNPDEKHKHNVALSLVYKLDEIKSTLEWMRKPVRAEGYLQRNSNGRFELDGIELTSGSPIDAWDEEYEEWITTRIEHHEDYYIYHLREQDPQDTLVRIK